MDISVLLDFANVIIVRICLCVGYILKNAVTTDKINRFIPLIMGVLGVLLSLWINKALTPEILLIGLISGLASTGLYEMFRNLIEKGEK